MKGYGRMKTFVEKAKKSDLLKDKKNTTVVTVTNKKKQFGTGGDIDMSTVRRDQKKMFNKEETIIEKKGKKFKEIKIETTERKSVIPTNKLPLMSGKRGRNRKRSKGKAKRLKTGSLDTLESDLSAEKKIRKKKISAGVSSSSNKGTLEKGQQLKGDGMVIRVSNGEANFLKGINEGKLKKYAEAEDRLITKTNTRQYMEDENNPDLKQTLKMTLGEDSLIGFAGKLERRDTQGRRSASNGKISVNKGSYLNAKMEQFEESMQQKVKEISGPNSQTNIETSAGVKAEDYHRSDDSQDSSIDYEEVGYVHDIYSYRDSVQTNQLTATLESLPGNDFGDLNQIIMKNPGITNRHQSGNHSNIPEMVTLKGHVAGQSNIENAEHPKQKNDNLDVKGVLKNTQKVKVNEKEKEKKPRKRVSFSKHTENFKFQKGEMLDKGLEKLNSGSYQEQVRSSGGDMLYSDDSQSNIDSQQITDLEDLNKQESFRVNMGSMESEGFMHYGSGEPSLKNSNASSMKVRSPIYVSGSRDQEGQSPILHRKMVSGDNDMGNEIIFTDTAREPRPNQNGAIYEHHAPNRQRQNQFSGRAGFGNLSQEEKGSNRNTNTDYAHLTQSQEGLSAGNSKRSIEKNGNITRTRSNGSRRNKNGGRPKRVDFEEQDIIVNEVDSGSEYSEPNGTYTNDEITPSISSNEAVREVRMVVANKGDLINFPERGDTQGILLNHDRKVSRKDSGEEKKRVSFNFHKSGTFREEIREFNEGERSAADKIKRLLNQDSVPYVINEITSDGTSTNSLINGSKRSLKGNKKKIFYFQDSSQISETEESPKQPLGIETPNFGAFWQSEHMRKRSRDKQNDIHGNRDFNYENKAAGNRPNQHKRVGTEGNRMAARDFGKKKQLAIVGEVSGVEMGVQEWSGVRGYDSGSQQVVVRGGDTRNEQEVGHVSEDVIVVSKRNSSENLQVTEREVGKKIKNNTSIMIPSPERKRIREKNYRLRGSFSQKVDSIYGELDRTLENIELNEGWDSESSKNEPDKRTEDFLRNLLNDQANTQYGDDRKNGRGPEFKEDIDTRRRREKSEQLRKERILNMVGISIKDMKDLQSDSQVRVGSSSQFEWKREGEEKHKTKTETKQKIFSTLGQGLGILGKFSRKTNKYRLGSVPIDQRRRVENFASVRLRGKTVEKKLDQGAGTHQSYRQTRERFASTPGKDKKTEHPVQRYFQNRKETLQTSNQDFKDQAKLRQFDIKGGNIKDYMGDRSGSGAIFDNKLLGSLNSKGEISKQDIPKREKVFQNLEKFMVSKKPEVFTKKPKFSFQIQDQNARHHQILRDQNPPSEPQATVLKNSNQYNLTRNMANSREPNSERLLGTSPNVNQIKQKLYANRRRSPHLKPREYLHESQMSNSQTQGQVNSNKDYKLYRNARTGRVGSMPDNLNLRPSQSEERSKFESQTQNGYNGSLHHAQEAARLRQPNNAQFQGGFLRSLNANNMAMKDTDNQEIFRGRGRQRDIFQNNYVHRGGQARNSPSPRQPPPEVYADSMPNHNLLTSDKHDTRFLNYSQGNSQNPQDLQYNLNHSQSHPQVPLLLNNTPLINVTSNYNLDNILDGKRTNLSNWKLMHSRAETRSVPDNSFEPFNPSAVRQMQTKLARNEMLARGAGVREGAQQVRSTQFIYHPGQIPGESMGHPVRRALSPNLELYKRSRRAEKLVNGPSPRRVADENRIRSKSQPMREKGFEIHRNPNWGLRDQNILLDQSQNQNLTSEPTNFDLQNLNIAAAVPVYQFNSGNNIKNNININIMMKKSSGPLHNEGNRPGSGNAGYYKLSTKNNNHNNTHVNANTNIRDHMNTNVSAHINTMTQEARIPSPHGPALTRTRRQLSSQTLGNRSGSLVSQHESIVMARMRPLSRGDLLAHLVDLFRKLLVYSTKIRSLKQKIKNQNADFHSWPIFREFSKRGGRDLSLEDLGLLFYNLGFHFSEDFIFKILIYLSRYRFGFSKNETGNSRGNLNPKFDEKLSSVKETTEYLSQFSHMRMKHKQNPDFEHSPPHTHTGPGKPQETINFREFSKLFELQSGDTNFPQSTSPQSPNSTSQGTYIMEMDYHLIRQIIILMNRKLEDVSTIIQFARSYTSQQVFKTILEFSPKPQSDQFSFPSKENSNIISSKGDSGSNMLKTPSPSTGSPKSELFSFMKNSIPSPAVERKMQTGQGQELQAITLTVLSRFLKANGVQFIEADLSLIMSDLTGTGRVSFEDFDRFLMSHVWDI